MDREFGDELTGLMPVVPHRIGRIDCVGRIVAVVEGGTVELRCNQCGDVVGVVQTGIMEALLGLDCAEDVCPHCGKLNIFSALDDIASYVCQHCGTAVDAIDPEP